MLDGESEEDEDEPNDTDVELPSGAGVDLTVRRALPEATAPLREQRPNDAFARMMSHSRLQGMQPSQRASSSSSNGGMVKYSLAKYGRSRS